MLANHLAHATQNLNTKGKVQKMHHASKVMFAEKVGLTMLVLHFPDQKDYKLNFVVRLVPARLLAPKRGARVCDRPRCCAQALAFCVMVGGRGPRRVLR